jgi:trk system potassium uptake protein TrkH
MQSPAASAAWHSLFHAVSAFNNAGFDISGGPNSMQEYRGDYTVVLATAVLIIAGGISFVTLNNIYSARRSGRLSLDSKLVLRATAVLLFFGWAVTFLTEFSNPATLGNLPLPEKLLASFFHSVTARTAGFTTLDVSSMASSTLLFTMALMFIGGSTGSTAGGIKVNTAGLLAASLWSALRGQPHPRAFGRELTDVQVHRGFMILLLSLGAIGAVLFLLSLTEDADFLSLLFESVSAFGTVGLTTGITAGLSVPGKLFIAALIFTGRLGPFTLAVALFQREKPSRYRYPQESIRIG